jgi:hypothetical protein
MFKIVAFGRPVIVMTNEVLLHLQLRACLASNELQQLSLFACMEQKHLDADSAEQAYWHHGYYSAVVDVMRTLGYDSANVPILDHGR